MATNASAREYNIIVAKQDVSATSASIGSITDPLIRIMLVALIY